MYPDDDASDKPTLTEKQIEEFTEFMAAHRAYYESLSDQEYRAYKERQAKALEERERNG